MSQNLTAELISFSKDRGADLFGIADLSRISPERNLISEQVKKGMSRVVVAGIRLSEAILAEITDHPTRTYYHHYRMVNMALDQLALSITRFLQERDFAAYPVPASQITDWKSQQGIFSHKHAAVQAGLGWIGRSNLLVTPQFGSQVRLVSVLTDASLEAAKPLHEDCGVCRACLAVCPAEAIKDDPAAFDHHRCYAQLDSFVRKRIVGQHICGICVRACSQSR
ncbi:MAG: epoxyqueuosine reductase [Candidatus Stahlbacteria bacterium]|nr:MAG: epoxyqueuosine reductase [Candidatus Stahlbacteria bacterium]